MAIKYGFYCAGAVHAPLLSMYGKLGKIMDARKLFDDMSSDCAASINPLIQGLGFGGFHEEVIMAFDPSQCSKYYLHSDSIAAVVLACTELGCLDKGLSVHQFVAESGIHSTVVSNSLISMYVNMGRLHIARQVFDSMPSRDVVSWNSLILGYARSINWSEAFQIFTSMKTRNICPNHVTFLGLTLACGQAGDIRLAESIHGQLIRLGIMWDLVVGTSAVDMYAKCGKIHLAHIIFEKELAERNLVSWNSLIMCYSRNKYGCEAVTLFCQMLTDSNIEPDAITMANLIPSCADLSDLDLMLSIHGFILKKGIEIYSDVVLGTSMVDAYGKCLNISASKKVFLSLYSPNASSWNALISAYKLNGDVCSCMELFTHMYHEGVVPDSVTLVTLLQLCREFGSGDVGRSVHGYCIRNTLDSFPTIRNAMIDMYMISGCVKSSEILFNSMLYRNVVTWNTMLGGYIKNDLPMFASKLFHNMQLENLFRPDAITVISVIQASSCLSSLSEAIHTLIFKNGLSMDTAVLNSLIDAYCKKGSIENAHSLFGQMDTLRDQRSWNVIISGCGMNGLGEEACSLFTLMEHCGQRPNSVTFLSLLSSCSHSGMVSKGREYFDLMIKKYEIEPNLEHYTCVIDIYGRAGRLEEAYHLIEQMPSNMVREGVWAALLSSCKTYMNTELGKLVGENLLCLEQGNCGYYTTLSNIYALRGRWEEATKARRTFEKGQLMKTPGWSMVKIYTIERPEQ